MKNNKLILIAMILFFSCNKDIENVKLEVSVFDETTNLPIEGAKIEIENAYYEGGDFDSYNHYQNLEKQTDANGHIYAVFKKSAYIQVEVFKIGYSTEFKATEVYRKKQKFKFYLKRVDTRKKIK